MKIFDSILTTRARNYFYREEEEPYFSMCQEAVSAFLKGKTPPSIRVEFFTERVKGSRIVRCGDAFQQITFCGEKFTPMGEHLDILHKHGNFLYVRIIPTERQD